MSRHVFLGQTSTKQGLICLAQGHNAVTPVRLEPATLQSQDKHSTTEPLAPLTCITDQSNLNGDLFLCTTLLPTFLPINWWDSSFKHVFTNRVENSVDPDQLALINFVEEKEVQIFRLTRYSPSPGQTIMLLE